MKTFAEKLRAARAAAELSQQALADLTTIPRRTIQDWEGGRMTPPEYVQRFVLNELEKGIYLICRDSMDDACEILGYIHGTSEDAGRYCAELDKNNRYAWQDHTWERLEKLPTPKE